MADTIRELLIAVGVAVDSKELQKLEGTITSVAGKFQAFAAALLTGYVAKGVVSFIGKQVEAGFQMRRMSTQLGMTTDEYQRLHHSANLAGESTDKFDRALRFLLKNQGKAEVGLKAGTKEWDRLGLKIKDANGNFIPLSEQLPIMADKLKAMTSQAQRTRAAMAVFGIAGAQVLPWLQEGSEKVKEDLADLDKLGGGMSRTFIEGSSAVAVQLRRLHTALQSLVYKAITPILPQILDITKKMIDWATKTENVEKVTRLVTNAFDGLKRVIDSGLIPAMMKAFMVFQTISLALGILNSPLALACLAFIGIYLAIDELKGAAEGADSVLGDLIKKMGDVPQAKETMDAVKNQWKDLNVVWSDTSTTLGKLWSEIVRVGVAIGKALGPSTVMVISVALQALGAIIEGLAMQVRILIAGLVYLAQMTAASFSATGPEDSKKQRSKANAEFDRTMNDILGMGKDKKTPVPNEKLPYGPNPFGFARQEVPPPSAASMAQPYGPNPFGFASQMPAGVLAQNPTPSIPIGPPRAPPMEPGAPRNVNSHIIVNMQIDGSKDPRATAQAVTDRLSGLSREVIEGRAAVP